MSSWAGRPARHPAASQSATTPARSRGTWRGHGIRAPEARAAATVRPVIAPYRRPAASSRWRYWLNQASAASPRCGSAQHPLRPRQSRQHRAPGGVGPFAQAERLQEQRPVGGLVGEQVEVDRDPAGAARAARGRLVVAAQQAVVEVARLRPQLQAGAHDRHPALELVDREPHAGLVQPAQRRLDPELGEHPGDVPELRARVQEQGPVRAAWIGVDGPFEDRQQGFRPAGELIADGAPAALGARMGAEEGGQAGEVARPGSGLGRQLDGRVALDHESLQP